MQKFLAFSPVWERAFLKSSELQLYTQDHSLACIQNIIGYIYGGELPTLLELSETEELERAVKEFQVRGLLTDISHRSPSLRE